MVCSYWIAAGAAEWAETAEPEANEEEDEADDPGHHPLLPPDVSRSMLPAFVTGNAHGVVRPESIWVGRLTKSSHLWRRGTSCHTYGLHESLLLHRLLHHWLHRLLHHWLLHHWLHWLLHDGLHHGLHRLAVCIHHYRSLSHHRLTCYVHLHLYLLLVWISHLDEYSYEF